MSIHALVLLMIALAIGMLFALLAGSIAFGVARWGGAPVPESINRGSFVAFSIMTLFVALLGALLPLLA
ncbi:hypothetical protein ACPCBX_25255 [Streptomyces tuirus]|uniref:Uncharacterized protein n=1 Tax=Streptomyces tuirus TaxID=68278 RepID=A0A7G1NRH6_9ACTN|nr:hypothetical protein [Streptomyces tuirus]BCL18187.1 hypothetical protein GCM10017668_00300 [Streptomyces tuirus]BCL25112.1 hypothetical protein GCM10017668_69550 [Streptomyces tuirus]